MLKYPGQGTIASHGGTDHNIGEKEGFSTSQRENADGSAGDLSGKAVDTNADQTDRINEGQNTGYTRLLETRQTEMPDGTAPDR